MKEMVLVALAALLLSPAADADPRKHWYKDPKQLAGYVIIGLAIGLDAHSTATRPHGVVESNWLLGKNPSNQKIAGAALLDFGIQAGLHTAAWHVIHHEPVAASCTDYYTDWNGRQRKMTRCTQYDQDNLFWRSLAYTAVPAETAILNGHAAARNYQLR